jgi:hypothetical protein
MVMTKHDDDATAGYVIVVVMAMQGALIMGSLMQGWRGSIDEILARKH